MIFYFSGTGNSAWAARQIGFVFPIYTWGAPKIMADFAKRLPKPPSFTFGVCTCGGDAGLAMKQFSKLYPLNSSYSLVMPNNYIIGSDTDEEGKIRQKISAARAELERMAQEIQQQEPVYRVHEGGLARVKSHLVSFWCNKFVRSAKPFFCGGQLQRLRPVCRKLPRPRHRHEGWQARLGGTVLSVHGLHQCLSPASHTIRKGHRRAALHHPGLPAPGRAMR